MRRRLSVLVAMVVMLAMLLASGVAWAAEGGNGNHSGQAKNGNNGNHYGQIKHGCGLC
jgi:hypothetical protein